MGAMISWGTAAPMVSHFSLVLNRSGLGSALRESPYEVSALLVQTVTRLSLPDCQSER